MPPRKKNNAEPCNKHVFVILIQEPFEEGSAMDFGLIKGDDVRFLHQAFITDTMVHALSVGDADVRLYYQNQPDRVRLVKIVMDYLKKKLTGAAAQRFEANVSTYSQKKDRWGVRVEHAFKECFDANVSTYSQKKDRWGVRVEHAFKECFDAGYESVLLVGSRTPTVSPTMLKSACKMLSESDAIFGPTPEGRYYTLGMSGSYQIELSAFDWKSPSIYADVASAFTDKGLRWAEMPIWYAVESSEELEIMARDINQFRFEGDEQTARETELVMERILAKLS